MIVCTYKQVSRTQFSIASRLKKTRAPAFARKRNKINKRLACFNWNVNVPRDELTIRDTVHSAIDPGPISVGWLWVHVGDYD